MFNRSEILLLCKAGAAFFCLCLSLLGKSQNCQSDQYLMTQAVDPSGEAPFWHRGKDEVQGVANDGVNWFIATAHLTVNVLGRKEYDNGTLWRIPLAVDLGGNSIPEGVSMISVTEIPALRDLKYFHLGDPDYYRYNGVGYILVPTYEETDAGPNIGAIVCFRASDLKYINFTYVLDEKPGFCFVDSTGSIYVKENQTALSKYTPNWDQLTDPSSLEHNALGSACTINLSLEGSGTTEIDGMQGGEISDSGETLFLSSGSANFTGNREGSDGINMFHVSSNACNSTWDWLDSSENIDSGDVPFTFLFDNGGGGTQSPQGLTFWDIDSPSVSARVRGKVHVMLFDYDRFLNSGNNKIFFYHFSDFIHVDGENGLINPVRRIGGIAKPFKFFNDAFFHYPAWDGSTIVLKSGTYSETGTYDKCVKLTSEGGPVIIGQ